MTSTHIIEWPGQTIIQSATNTPGASTFYPVLPSSQWCSHMICYKQRYTLKEARTALNSRKRSKHGNPKRGLRIYFCKQCNAHHLTAKPHYNDEP
jgi:hypothetical protein